MTPKIEKLIIKYVTNSATVQDLDILTEWIKDPTNKREFKNYVYNNYAITYSINNPDSKNALDRLLRQIQKEKSWSYRLITQPIYKYAAAAILVGVLATTYFFKDNLFETSVEEGAVPIIVNTNTIEPGTDKAVLTLEDGSQIALEKGNSIQMQNATSNGEELVYENKDSEVVELVYNYLTVPRGGQFFIELSDGTKVWLNSETQLKYPVNFLEDQTREVELVYGEAYFDVSPSSNHNGSKFKVFNQSQEVEVLGTEFNVKAYKDEDHVYTTLVEGKVFINIENKKESLAPNQQLDFDVIANTTKIQVVDVYSEVSWKDGVFSFKGKPLKDIMKVLSRWYDVDVVFSNKELESIKFKGNLNKDRSIERILSLMLSTKLNSYEIKDKTIILK